MFSFSSRCSRSNSWPSCASKVSRLSPSTPPLPRFAFTLSQAISRFFRLYTLSINEWTFFASVRLIQSTSLLRRERTGFSLMELFLLLAFTPLVFFLFPTIFAGWPSPTQFRRRLPGHAAFAALQVLFSRPYTDRASLATSLSLIGLLTPVPPRDSVSTS